MANPLGSMIGAMGGATPATPSNGQQNWQQQFPGNQLQGFQNPYGWANKQYQKFNNWQGQQPNPTDPTSGGGLMSNPYASFQGMTPQQMTGAGFGNRFQNMYSGMQNYFNTPQGGTAGQGGQVPQFNQNSFMQALLSQMMRNKPTAGGGGGGGQTPYLGAVTNR